MSRDFQRIEELYHQALSRPEADRANFLASTCAGDEELRREVDALLACQQKAGQFMDSPALDVAARMLVRTRGRMLIGTRLGPYEILALLGAGGMGEVYRARDTRLNRDVALKVLPEALAQAPERMARFQREAQMLAALNHPNIAAIYRLEESDGIRALVMELVEGPTLAERLLRSPLSPGYSPAAKGEAPSSPTLYKRGPQWGVPLSLEEALTIAKQVAEGLEYAHERGIIHRDLKPANVKITPEGVVKILDFGLAKAAEGTRLTGDPASSPTPAMPATQTGLILGTAAYMAPEQARGQLVDKRADIWAFGVVLYEILTGRQLFGAETVSDTLVAVLKSEPDWSGLPESVPANLRKLLRRCLERDRKKRLQAIGDARIEIEECLSAPAGVAEAEAGISAEHQRALLKRERWVWVGVATVLLVTIASLVAYLRPAQAPATAIIAEIPPPANAQFGFLGESGGPPVISPDGRTLAFSALDASGKQLLWVRPLGSLTARPLSETEGAAWPFWSKDSRTLGFFADGKLKTIETSAGTATVFTDAPFGEVGTWNYDGTILLASVSQKILYRVAASGGVPVPVIKLDASKYWACAWPVSLPDGKHFLYAAYANDLALTGTYFASLDGKENRLLIQGQADSIYAQGFLLYLSGDTLMGQTFDPERGQRKGEPHPVAEGVAANPYRYIFDVSENGVLIYQRDAGKRRLRWFGRSGEELDFIGEFEGHSVSLSPDGRKLAFCGGPNGDIYVNELASGVATRLTVDPDTEPDRPVWSPDGARIIFGAVAGKARRGIYQKPSSGAGAEELLLAPETPDATLYPMSWSGDGKFILYGSSPGGSGAMHLQSVIWVLPLEGDRKPRVFVQAPVTAYDGQFSPDGRWVAYTSRESGRNEVYIVPFDADAVLKADARSSYVKAGARRQISTGGGGCARWRGDGKEIFYLSWDNQIMAVPITSGANPIEGQRAQPLFRPITGSPDEYDVTPDGKKFLIKTSTGTNTPLTLVVNWTALLAGK